MTPMTTNEALMVGGASMIFVGSSCIALSEYCRAKEDSKEPSKVVQNINKSPQTPPDLEDTAKLFIYKEDESADTVEENPGKEIIKRLGKPDNSEKLVAFSKDALKTISEIQGQMPTDFRDKQCTGASKPSSFITRTLCVDNPNLMKETEMKFLETFKSLFKTVFEQEPGINLRLEESAISQLEIKDEIEKLKQSDLLKFATVLLAISEGSISASAETTVKSKKAETDGQEEAKTVVKKLTFGAQQQDGKPHIEFTGFGWKLIVAAFFEFSMIQYAARHELFNGYIKKLDDVYAEKMKRVEADVKELDKMELQKKFETLEAKFNSLKGACDVFSKFFKEDEPNVKKFNFFFKMLNSYGINIKTVKSDGKSIFSFYNLAFPLNSTQITGASIFDVNTAYKAHVYPGVFALCMLVYKCNLVVEKFNETEPITPIQLKWLVKDDKNDFLPCIEDTKPNANCKIIDFYLFLYLAESMNNRAATSESSYCI